VDEDVKWREMTPALAADFLLHLRSVHSRRRGEPRHLALADGKGVAAEPRLSAASVNRALAAVSSFYDWALLAGGFTRVNPFTRVHNHAAWHVSDRHRPFLAGIAREQPTRRALRVRTTRRLPRPLEEDAIKALLAQLRSRRDLALVRLMLDGGLRPGEALGIHLTDVAYGRRRIVVRIREDHPHGVRTKSRQERVVDLHIAATLEAVAAYVMHERPREAETPILFLVGGCGSRKCEPLSYAALARLFARACARAGIRTPLVTPHALLHTHATRMWEGGMRELTLQRRLGHASPESTRLYTRVSDAETIADYRKALGLKDKSSHTRGQAES